MGLAHAKKPEERVILSSKFSQGNLMLALVKVYTAIPLCLPRLCTKGKEQQSQIFQVPIMTEGHVQKTYLDFYFRVILMQHEAHRANYQAAN